jgi:hypothetical protein
MFNKIRTYKLYLTERQLLVTLSALAILFVVGNTLLYSALGIVILVVCFVLIFLMALFTERKPRSIYLEERQEDV